MASQEYSTNVNHPESLTPEILEMVFAVVQEQSVACLSDLKRETGLKYAEISAALQFLESKKLINVMTEKAKELALQDEQIPVKVTKDGRRTSLQEVSKMLS